MVARAVARLLVACMGEGMAVVKPTAWVKEWEEPRALCRQVLLADGERYRCCSWHGVSGREEVVHLGGWYPRVRILQWL